MTQFDLTTMDTLLIFSLRNDLSDLLYRRSQIVITEAQSEVIKEVYTRMVDDFVNVHDSVIVEPGAYMTEEECDTILPLLSVRTGTKFQTWLNSRKALRNLKELGT